MQIQSIFIEDKSDGSRKRLTPQNKSIAKNEVQDEIIPPIFDLAEHEDFYLLSVDLAGLPLTGTEVQAKTGELQITADRTSELGSLSSNIFFRLRSFGNHVRSTYYKGQLWILLPKMMNF